MASRPIQTRRAPAGAAAVDHTALRFNQATIIALLTLAFLLDQPWLVAAVAAVLALGTAVPALALFQRVYRDLLKPAGLLRADIQAEDPAPHRFAQGLGAAVLVAASAALFAGAGALGWVLAWAVITLAAANVLLGFCAGCFVFFQLQRLRGRQRGPYA